MFFRNRKMIADVRRILGWVGGGVHKRIDENRELLELLRDKRRLSSSSRIRGWFTGSSPRMTFYVSWRRPFLLLKGNS
jgi:hypothetical protein